MSKPLNWKKSKEADEFGTPRPTYRADLPDGAEVVIRSDGIPSWPFTLTWPDGQGTFITNRLYTAKAEAQAYADHIEEVSA